MSLIETNDENVLNLVIYNFTNSLIGLILAPYPPIWERISCIRKYSIINLLWVSLWVSTWVLHFTVIEDTVSFLQKKIYNRVAKDLKWHKLISYRWWDGSIETKSCWKLTNKWRVFNSGKWTAYFVPDKIAPDIWIYANSIVEIESSLKL